MKILPGAQPRRLHARGRAWAAYVGPRLSYRRLECDQVRVRDLIEGDARCPRDQTTQTPALIDSEGADHAIAV